MDQQATKTKIPQFSLKFHEHEGRNRSVDGWIYQSMNIDTPYIFIAFNHMKLWDMNLKVKKTKIPQISKIPVQ